MQKSKKTLDAKIRDQAELQKNRDEFNRYIDKYDDSFIERAVAIFECGGTQSMVARELGISHRTLTRWLSPCSKHFRKDFAIACERAHTAGEAAYDEIGLNQLKKPKEFFNAVMYQMWGRQKYNWTEHRKLDFKKLATATDYDKQILELQKLLKGGQITAVEFATITKSFASIAQISEIEKIKNDIEELKNAKKN